LTLVEMLVDKVKSTGEKQVKAAATAAAVGGVLVAAGTWKFQGKPNPAAIAIVAITAPIATVAISIGFLGGM